MQTACLRFQTPDVHGVLSRALRFVRVAEVGIASVNIEHAAPLHCVEMLLFAESAEALGLLVRRIQSLIGVLNLEICSTATVE